MKFSINTNALRKNYSVEEIADVAAQAGAQGIEWGLSKIENAASEAAAMQKATQAAGLEIVSFINAGPLWKTDEIRRWSEAIAASGGHVMRVAHPWFAWDYNESIHQPDDFMTLVNMTREGLAKLMDMGKEFDIKYVMETHPGSCFASPLTVPWLLKDFDPRYCGLIFDPANTILEGFVRLRGAVELMNDYIAYIHVKNLAFKETVNENGKHIFATERRTVDCGMLDYTELMFALKLQKWDGWLSFEEFVNKDAQQIVTEVSNGIAHLKKCCAEAVDSLQEPFLTFNR